MSDVAKMSDSFAARFTFINGAHRPHPLRIRACVFHHEHSGVRCVDRSRTASWTIEWPFCWHRWQTPMRSN